MLRMVLLLVFLPQILFTQPQTLKAGGLQQPVEIIVDHWGVPHIYTRAPRTKKRYRRPAF
ncbi:MAG: hypothetical protein KDC75_08625 [Phaeodactylibacter sp.]|nr:hypothetical protein [Phaeodactylibacter sp.]